MDGFSSTGFSSTANFPLPSRPEANTSDAVAATAQSFGFEFLDDPSAAAVIYDGYDSDGQLCDLISQRFLFDFFLCNSLVRAHVMLYSYADMLRA